MKQFGYPGTSASTVVWLARLSLRVCGLVCVMVLGACSLLKPVTAEPTAFYALGSASSAVPQHAPEPASRALPTLIITPTHAAPGHDSQRIIYVRYEHQLEYFAHSEWVDTPARMLGPLMASAMQGTGAFGAVVLSPAGASGDLRLESEIIRLQHNFQSQPSRVQFTLRAFLLYDKTRRVLAWRELSEEQVSATETPQGGVAAASKAVNSVLNALAGFVALHAQ